MKRVTRFVCDSCGAVHFAEVVEGQGGKCPTCKGQGSVRSCEMDDAGGVRPVEKKEK